MEDYLQKILKRIEANLPLNDKQQLFLDEYNLFKNIVLQEGAIYIHKTEYIKYRLENIDEVNNQADVITLSSGKVNKKTLHWCRKRLELA
jgi:hypothetical protein